MRTTIRIPVIATRLSASAALLVVALALLGVGRGAHAALVPGLHGVVAAADLRGGCAGLEAACRPAPARCEHVIRCAALVPVTERPAPPAPPGPVRERAIVPAGAPQAWLVQPVTTPSDRYLLTRRLRI